MEDFFTTITSTIFQKEIIHFLCCKIDIYIDNFIDNQSHMMTSHNKLVHLVVPSEFLDPSKTFRLMSNDFILILKH